MKKLVRRAQHLLSQTENELFPPLLAECGHCRPARSAGQASARPGLAGVGVRGHSWPSARAASATPLKLSFRDSRRNSIHLSDDSKRETSFGARLSGSGGQMRVSSPSVAVFRSRDTRVFRTRAPTSVMGLSPARTAGSPRRNQALAESHREFSTENSYLCRINTLERMCW